MIAAFNESLNIKILIVSFFLLVPNKVMALTINSVDVIRKFPHDNSAFTQGLEFYEGRLYEGTGLKGKSEIREVDLETGRVLRRKSLEQKYFGEGITILGNKIFQLTWKSGKGFIYDLESFDFIGEFEIEGEGWGLTNDGSNLILSNGSDQIQYLNPQNLQITKRVNVKINGEPQHNINELEYVGDEIWANVWKNDNILRIDPVTGEVKSILNLSSISERHSKDDVANGIAWDQKGRKIYITGKFWSYVYQIRLD